MSKRFIFSVANNGHEFKSWVATSGKSKTQAAAAWDAEYILHTDINGFITAPSKQVEGFYEKFELFRRCDGDILFTDSDVVLLANCPNPFIHLDQTCFHAVWESEWLVKARFYEELWPERMKLFNELSKGDWDAEDNTQCPRFFNSGVMYFPKAVRDLFISRLDEVREIVSQINSRKKGGFADQEIFNYIVRHYQREGFLKVQNLPPSWNIQVSLEWRGLMGVYPWQRFRRHRYWRRQAYWTKDARFDDAAFAVHYTGKSRSLLETEYTRVFEPGWKKRKEKREHHPPVKPARQAPCVLLISPEAWDALDVSKHHYARTLAEKGTRVLFMGPPDMATEGIKLLPVADLPNLEVVKSGPVARGLRFYPAALRKTLESRWLSNLEDHVGCQVDTIWLFENSRFFDMQFAGDRLKIYHQVDLNQNFHPEQASASANICFCTSETIRRELIPHNPRCYKIDHGYAEQDEIRPLPKEFARKFDPNKPNVVYIGNMNRQYIDRALLISAVEKFPTAVFHFIGDYAETDVLWQQTHIKPNAVWWGRVDSHLIPAILENSQVLLAAYDSERWRVHVGNPHKFMEYLGSGKTIVATDTEEYRDRPDLLQMVHSREDYLPELARVLSNLNEYNSPERVSRRRKFAASNSYHCQLKNISDLIDQNGFDSSCL